MATTDTMSSALLAPSATWKAHARERLTYDEFCSRIHEQKADLIEGEIFMASPATIKHEDFVGFLWAILRLFVKRKNLGIVVGSRVAMKLSEEDGPEPDLLFVRRERLHLLRNTEILGPADLVIEIISPGSRHLDAIKKKEQYAAFGVPEYWLIDLYRHEAHFWRNEAGEWKDLPIDAEGIFRSHALPGFWLQVDWLFAVEQPDEGEIVQIIMAGKPSETP